MTVILRAKSEILSDIRQFMVTHIVSLTHSSNTENMSESLPDLAYMQRFDV